MFKWKFESYIEDSIRIYDRHIVMNQLLEFLNWVKTQKCIVAHWIPAFIVSDNMLFDRVTWINEYNYTLDLYAWIYLRLPESICSKMAAMDGH